LDQVIVAILGARESAAEGGYELQSSFVTWTDPVDADALRDALAAQKVENVMLVSAFAAAAALAQAVGSATSCARTALLFVEPRTATLAVVNTTDGSIVEVQCQPLSAEDEAALAGARGADAARAVAAGASQGPRRLGPPAPGARHPRALRGRIATYGE
jgi:hypothetical protein